MLSKEVAIIASLLSNDIRIEGSACWDLTPFMLLKREKEPFPDTYITFQISELDSVRSISSFLP